MSELSITYTQDGEWLMAETSPASPEAVMSIGPSRSGLVPLIEAEPQDLTDQASLDSDGRVRIDMRDSRGWGVMASEHGHFGITIPPERPLEDWGLELWALSRAYDKLKMEAVSELFGPSLSMHLSLIYTETRPYHQSFGDLRVTKGARGPLTMAEVAEYQQQSPVLTKETPEDINQVTRTARQRLLDRARQANGGFVVSRSVLLQS